MNRLFTAILAACLFLIGCTDEQENGFAEALDTRSQLDDGVHCMSVFTKKGLVVFEAYGVEEHDGLRICHNFDSDSTYKFVLRVNAGRGTCSTIEYKAESNEGPKFSIHGGEFEGNRIEEICGLHHLDIVVQW